jgi:HTH-type transcriptional regulator / antitoxin HigA
MIMKKIWCLFDNEQEYDEAYARFEQIKYEKKGDANYREKKLLAFLLDEYGRRTWTLEDPDPIEFIKIRMEDFGYKAADLAKVYGDKATVSKVLNYKQALSLTMIRKFSKLLQIPPEALIKEYELQ